MKLAKMMNGRERCQNWRTPKSEEWSKRTKGENEKNREVRWKLLNQGRDGFNFNIFSMGD